MTIEKDGRRQYFSCDIVNCDAEFDFERDDFPTAWAAAKREGWETKKIGRDWLHACPRHML
jgi:hypothetical protein